jgi:hypothetical protein
MPATEAQFVEPRWTIDALRLWTRNLARGKPSVADDPPPAVSRSGIGRGGVRRALSQASEVASMTNYVELSYGDLRFTVPRQAISEAEEAAVSNSPDERRAAAADVAAVLAKNYKRTLRQLHKKDVARYFLSKLLLWHVLKADVTN